jgi:hypothetical protein
MNDSSTQASAMPSEPPAIEGDRRDTGSARLKEKITRAMPAIIRVGTLISGSTSQRTFSLRITWYSIQGMRMTLSASVNAAET